MILGITGKTGSGKHTAAKYLEAKGWTVLDGDTIAHGLYRPGTAVYKSLVEAFSTDIVAKDKTIDRKRLHDLVFDARDPEQGKKNLILLNSLIHPALRAELEKRVGELRKRGEKGIVVGALWKELDLASLVDRVLVIEADSEIACERICKRDGIDREAFFERWKRQNIPPTSDFVLTNDGSYEVFFRQIDSVLGLWGALC